MEEEKSLREELWKCGLEEKRERGEVWKRGSVKEGKCRTMEERKRGSVKEGKCERGEA